MRTCYVCMRPPSDDVELRPYGPNGQDICFECMTADPEREAEAKRQFFSALKAAGNVAVIGGDHGPVPISKESLS